MTRVRPMLENLRSTIRFRPFTFDRTGRRLERVANIDDLRSLAQRRVPGGVFDYIDGDAPDRLLRVPKSANSVPNRQRPPRLNR